MSHQEKQEIFDQYAQKQGYQKWEDLVMFSGFTFSARLALITHMYNACDLVQEEQQKRISDNTKMLLHDGFHKSNKQTKYYQIGADNLQIDKTSIINPENLIK